MLHKPCCRILNKVFVLYSASLAVADDAHEDGTSYCAFVDTKVRTERKNGELTVENVDRSETAGGGGGLYPNETIQCEKGKNFCYTLWSIDPVNKNQTVILMQGASLTVSLKFNGYLIYSNVMR